MEGKTDRIGGIAVPPLSSLSQFPINRSLSLSHLIEYSLVHYSFHLSSNVLCLAHLEARRIAQDHPFCCDGTDHRGEISFLFSLLNQP